MVQGRVFFGMGLKLLSHVPAMTVEKVKTKNFSNSFVFISVRKKCFGPFGARGREEHGLVVCTLSSKH